MPAPERKKKVLIVDDSRALLESLSAAFEQAGWKVSQADDGSQVFRALSANDPDALLLDVYMPTLNGADVCRLVKAHPRWKKTFVVLMSGRMSEKEIAAYRRTGADGFLRKPFAPEAAIELVDMALGSRA
jgi:DNA-binding response OmpR family regulator